MTMMISVARVADLPNPINDPTFHADHEAMYGDAMRITHILRDPNHADQIAMVGEVRDLEALRRISRTPEGDAMMRKWGFIEQMSYFLEEEA